MTLRLSLFSSAILLFTLTSGVSAQVHTLVGQFTNSPAESFAGSTSGDGRFVVFELCGDLATENPRNADGNVEIFLWDYAQRRIFQITDTKSVLVDRALGTVFSNIRIEIANKRPVISNDGRWIAFSSNATTSTPTAPDATNPGSFDADALTAPTPTPAASPTPTPSPSPTPAANPLQNDANLEMWLYQIPAYGAADLSSGDELPVTNLSGGTFIRVTNTDASRLPQPATATAGAFIADDNHDASINDDGNVIAFVSTRDLVPSVGNPFPNEDNDEIFTYVRPSSTLGQVTKTPRGQIANPIYSKNPTISGNGTRVVFASTGDGPVVGMTAGGNPAASRNEEIFYADLIGGSPTGATAKKQVTTTTPLNPGDPVTSSTLKANEAVTGNLLLLIHTQTSRQNTAGSKSDIVCSYVYNTTDNSFRQIGPRSTADTQATGATSSITRALPITTRAARLRPWYWKPGKTSNLTGRYRRRRLTGSTRMMPAQRRSTPIR